MATLRQSRYSVAGIVCVLFVAWMAAANHCALAAMPAWKTAEHRCCHRDQPVTPAHGQSSTACCESLGATVPLAAHAPQADLHVLPVIWPMAHSADSVFPYPLEVHPCETDTSPPGRSLLTDVLLRKSVPAHAPPVV